MKEAKLKIILLENEVDVNSFRGSSVGNMVLKPGTVLVAACVDGNECGQIPFMPIDVKGAKVSGVEQASDWIDTELFAVLEQ
jgi:hypothetical protein